MSIALNRDANGGIYKVVVDDSGYTATYYNPSTNATFTLFTTLPGVNQDVEIILKNIGDIIFAFTHGSSIYIAEVILHEGSTELWNYQVSNAAAPSLSFDTDGNILVSFQRGAVGSRVIHVIKLTSFGTLLQEPFYITTTPGDNTDSALSTGSTVANWLAYDQLLRGGRIIHNAINITGGGRSPVCLTSPPPYIGRTSQRERIRNKLKFGSTIISSRPTADSSLLTQMRRYAASGCSPVKVADGQNVLPSAVSVTARAGSRAVCGRPAWFSQKLNTQCCRFITPDV